MLEDPAAFFGGFSNEITVGKKDLNPKWKIIQFRKIL